MRRSFDQEVWNGGKSGLGFSRYTLGDQRDLVTIDLFGDNRRDLARRGRGVSRYFDGHNSV
jgi:hypothetical protein